MPDYQNGKIYKLWSPQGEEIYIGSTTQSLGVRKAGHKRMDCSSKILFEKYDDVRIELLECYPCDNKEELTKREGEYIRNNTCINKVILDRTKKEWYEDNKEDILEKSKDYYQENKEKILEKVKDYQENNKEKVKEYQKKYENENKKKISERCKKYREKNKEKMNEYKKEWDEKNKEIITCECGYELFTHNLNRHLLTKKHIKLLKTKL